MRVAEHAVTPVAVQLLYRHSHLGPTYDEA
jgi:hypothetical protein